MYYRYSPKQSAEIRRYACLHGVTATARYYSRKLSVQLAETTVRSIRDAYKEEIKLKWKDDGEANTGICTYVAQVKDTLEDKENAALIIMDDFRGQITPAINTLLEKNIISLPVIKELGTKWMVETAEYISENPQFITNGFIQAGIAGALDGVEEEAIKMNEDQADYEEDSEEDIEDYEEDSEEDIACETNVYEDDEPEVIVLA